MGCKVSLVYRWAIKPHISLLESTFKKDNNYPRYVINQLNREVKLKHAQIMNIERSVTTRTAQNEQEKRHLLVLPYFGNKGEKILKSFHHEFYLVTLKHALHILELNLAVSSN